MNWLLSKPWITNLEFKGSVVRSDRLSETKNRISSAAGTVSLHGKEEGYYVAEDYSSNPDAAAIIDLLPATGTTRCSWTTSRSPTS